VTSSSNRNVTRNLSQARNGHSGVLATLEALAARVFVFPASPGGKAARAGEEPARVGEEPATSGGLAARPGEEAASGGEKAARAGE